MIYQDSKIERAPKSAFAIIPGKNYQTYQKASTSFSEGQKNLFLQIKAQNISSWITRHQNNLFHVLAEEVGHLGEGD